MLAHRGTASRLSVAAKGVWDAAVELVFPMSCLVCAAHVEKALFCEGCLPGVLDPPDRRRCARCAMPMGPHARDDRGCSECRGTSLGFDAAIILGAYDGPLRDACLAIKHDQDAWMATWLADLLWRESHESLQAQAPQALVAVPLHWRRSWGRGYNQVDLIARRLSRHLGIPRLPLLKRVRPTPKLAGLSRQARHDLLKDAFAARKASATLPECVLLIDDILTTGSTAGAAARALKKAGVKRVVTAAIARAEGRG